MRNIFTKHKTQSAKFRGKDAVFVIPAKAGIQSITSRVQGLTLDPRLRGDDRSTCHFRLSTSSGYTLLFAMIVASIVLALGVSLLTVSRKEFVLSSNATQSTNAFYAADSGLGCAEYWDNIDHSNAFSTSSPVTPIQCSKDFSSGHTISVNVAENPTNTGFSFSVPLSTDGTANKSCVAVTVDKYYAYDADLGGQHLYTRITSAGYNIGWNGTIDGSGNATGDCSNASPKKVNRTIEKTY